MDSHKITKAFNFAAQKHSSQRRKGADAEPYINHPVEVGYLLAVNTDGKDVDLICAGVLHDTLEDTETSYEELVREFGKTVADIVQECTDDTSLTREERKRLQAENIGHKSDKAKMLKIADKTSNLNSTLEKPPLSWDNARKMEYLTSAKLVVDQCRGINVGLEKGFDAAYQRGLKAFGA
jgi:guanosine-3',5'-bis(diphosphate) 3'-pyrophosphohydrolase